jgi:hypothetical protein
LFSREELGNWVEERVGELGERVVYLGGEVEEEEEDSLGEELRGGRKGGRTTRSRVEID